MNVWDRWAFLHFCERIWIKSGIYSKLKGGYQDQQPQRSDPVLLKILPNTLENLTLHWLNSTLPVCSVERKGTIGSCLGSTQKCYCQSAEVSAGKSYRCNRLSTKFHKNFQQLINSWSAQLLRGGSNTKVDRVHKYETSSDCCPCRAIIFPPFYSAKMYRHRIAD